MFLLDLSPAGRFGSHGCVIFSIVISSGSTVPSLVNVTKTYCATGQTFSTSWNFPSTTRVKPVVLRGAELCLDPLVPMNVTLCGRRVFVAINSQDEVILE